MDDTDVIHFDMEKNETALEAHADLQEMLRARASSSWLVEEHLSLSNAFIVSFPLNGMHKVSGVTTLVMTSTMSLISLFQR